MFLQSIDKLESIKTARYYWLKNHITTVWNFWNSKINVEPDTSKTGTLYNKLATLLRNNVQDQETLALYAMVLIGALSRKVSREWELIESKNNNSWPIRIGDYQEKILKPLLKFSNNKSLIINVSRDNDITYDIVDMNTRSWLLFDENWVLYWESALMNISGYPILWEQKRYYPSWALKQTFRLRESSGWVVRDWKSTFYYENGNQAYEFEYWWRYYPWGMYGKWYTSIWERIWEWKFYYENGTIACKSQFVDSAEKWPREFFDKEGNIISIEEPSRLIKWKERDFDSNEFVNKWFQFLREKWVEMNIFQ